MALENKIPLILLPQTYGPFFTDKAKQIAVKIIKQATQVWARDERSYEILKDLLGNDFAPHQHRLGVDVAFLLEAQKPNQLSSELALNQNKNQLSQDLHRYNWTLDKRRPISVFTTIIKKKKQGNLSSART